jgi:hypothetical protein
MGLIDALRSILTNSNSEGRPNRKQGPDTIVTGGSQTPKANSASVTVTPIALFKYHFPEIGRLDAICPYCGAALDKFPGRKKKCPTCSKYIYVRTRPSDRRKVLVTEDEATEIEIQYDAISGIDTRDIEYRFTNEDAALFATRKLEMANALGREPENWQVAIDIFESECQRHARNNDWGLFRNAKLHIAMLYQKAGFVDKALPLYFEVCYVDINGGSNIGGVSSYFKPFDPSLAMIAPGVYGLILRALRHTELGEASLKEMFLVTTKSLQLEYQMPVSPELAFAQFYSQLKK